MPRPADYDDQGRLLTSQPAQEFNKIRWAYQSDCASAAVLHFLAWIDLIVLLIAAPFTAFISLLVALIVVPIKFVFVRMVNEQIRQTRLLTLLVDPEYRPRSNSSPTASGDLYPDLSRA